MEPDAEATASGGSAGNQVEGHRGLLADGTAIVVRRLTSADRDAVAALHANLPPDDIYLRFFTLSRVSSRIVEQLVAAEVVAYGAFARDRLVGVGHFSREPRESAPEIAVAVAHDAQLRGVASLLLEHLVSAASAVGIACLTAQVLAVNYRMLQVIRDIGLPHQISVEEGVASVAIEVSALGDLESTPEGEHYLDRLLAREVTAELASLRPVLAPRSLVVIGAGRRPGSVGSMLLGNIRAGGYQGAIHVVNPHAQSVGGVRCTRSIEELPPDIDLAVVSVPAAVVPDVAERCGQRGVRALLVVSSGVSSDPALLGGLVEVVGRYGMRLVGPNCLGLVNTDSATRLQATFAAPCTPGQVGIAAQSGGVAIGLGAELDRLGLGVSSMVSVGDAVDINGDDMLLWWADDECTKVAVLYVESVRRPAQFARLARRLARRIPLLAVRSGSSRVGRRAAASHSAGSATPRAYQDALFAHAGILAVDNLSGAIDALAVLCRGPLPAGPRVAVLSNAGGAGVLAVDACVRHGLAPANLRDETTTALRAVLPIGASLINPVDATATVPPRAFAAALDALLADPGIDSVVVLAAPTRAGNPLDGLSARSGRGDTKPVVAVRLDQPTRVDTLSAGGGEADVACFADPDAAAGALALATQRGRWLRRPQTWLPAPTGARLDEARRITAAALAEQPDGGWLPPAEAFALVEAAGVSTAPLHLARDESDPVDRWRSWGGPVMLKADVPGVVHKASAGAVLGPLDAPDAVVDGFRTLRSRFDNLRGVVMQPLLTGTGPELLAGVSADPVYGPLITIGLGGTRTDLIDDRAHCLAPPTGSEVDDLLSGLRASQRLFAGATGAGLREQLRAAVAGLSWLATHLPELAEAEINPLIPTDQGLVGVDARVRLAPASVSDPWLRTLPA